MICSIRAYWKKIYPFLRHIVRNGVLSALVFLCLGVFFHSAWALRSAVVVNKHSQAQLVADVESYTPGRGFHIGLDLTLEPGWHTYWVNPGDAGSPATLTLEGSPSDAYQQGDIEWPVPKRLAEGPLLSFAYEDHVFLVQPLKPESGHIQGNWLLHVHAQWLVCKEICVPEEGHFTLTLPQGDGKAGADEAVFVRAREFLPQAAPFKVGLDKAGRLVFKGETLSPNSVQKVIFMSATQGEIDLASPQHLQWFKESLFLTVKWVTPKPPQVAEGLVLLTDKAGVSHYFSIKTTSHSFVDDLTPLPPQTVSTQKMVQQKDSSGSAITALSFVSFPRISFLSLFHVLEILGFAFLGGMILNVMPCIFPILAVKAFSIVEISRYDLKRSRMGGVYYGLGVVLSFLTLGLVMLVGRHFGNVVGWGVQFQSVVFVVGMAWFLFVIGLNLLGVFEVGTSLTGAGQHYVPSTGYGQDFFSGLLVVILSTPCTAPFMGVAIAASLSMPFWLGAFVFVMLGLGLACPYVVIVSNRYVAKKMPKPGLWMEYVRQFLAFPLFLTCVWLLWVTSLQAGTLMVLGAGMGLVGLGFSCWLWGITQHGSKSSAIQGKKTYLLLRFISVALSSALVAWLLLGSHEVPLREVSTTAHISGASSTEGMQAWPKEQTFTLHTLEALRKQGKPVFVNITAAWCITCLVNERVALSSAAVQQGFMAHHITYLVGDWTRKNPEISQFLEVYGREGVPFYLYFPASGGAVVLPQILTPSLVLQMIHT